MDILKNLSVIWFILGFVFFLLEFMVPGFILFFFGIGAWIVAALTLTMDLSINMQMVIFLGTSLVSAALLRNWARKKLGMTNAQKGDLPDEIIGKTATAETEIQPGKFGKVAFKGSSWNATSQDTIAPGQDVIITSYESITLTVKLTSEN